jgi:hypothetical protein
MADEAEQARTCVYCGEPIKTGRACRQHSQLAAIDPHLGGMRRPLEESELGVLPPWPEGEAVDDDDAES